jgi:hypothetical protein
MSVLKGKGTEIRRPLMALMLNDRGLLLLDGVSEEASPDAMMVELKRRMQTRDSRVVIVTAHPKVSNGILEDLIRRLRTQEIEIKITMP